MKQNELNELIEGRKWLEELISNSRNIQIPSCFSHLSRRIHQLKCNSLYYRIPQPKFFRVLYRYFLGIGFIIFLLIKSKKSHDKINTVFSIWDSDIDPHVSCEDFNIFISSNQVISLKSGSLIFVKSNSHKKRFHNAIFLQNPIYEILGYLDISFIDGIILIFNIFKNFFTFLILYLSCPKSIGLFKDFLLEPIIKFYQIHGLVKFYRTNSHFNNQEFWCEGIDFNTVWYSINSRAIQYKRTFSEPIPENPLYYFEYFGTSLTWNECHAVWLKKFYEHKVIVTGPIMFYFLSKELKKTGKKKRILIFDVTPCEESYIRRRVAQKGYNYYNEDICINFISDILLALKGTDCEILLKPKRKYTDFHSKKYLTFLSRSQEENKNFKTLPPESNLFDEIQNSDFIITIPFSSPFDIARSLNIPTIYYDPSGEVDFESMGYTETDHVTNVAQLKQRLSKLNTA